MLKEEIIKNKLKIKIKNIDQIEINELILIYKKIKTFIYLEIKKGNGLDSAFLEIEYIKNFKTKEYINIRKIINEGYSFDFINFFKNIKEKEHWHEETNIIFENYLNNTEKKQNIIIEMIFNCKTNKEDIEKSTNV